MTATLPRCFVWQACPKCQPATPLISMANSSPRPATAWRALSARRRLDQIRFWSNDNAMSSQYATPHRAQRFYLRYHGREDAARPSSRCIEAATGKIRGVVKSPATASRIHPRWRQACSSQKPTHPTRPRRHRSNQLPRAATAHIAGAHPRASGSFRTRKFSFAVVVGGKLICLTWPSRQSQ